MQHPYMSEGSICGSDSLVLHSMCCTLSPPTCSTIINSDRHEALDGDRKVIHALRNSCRRYVCLSIKSSKLAHATCHYNMSSLDPQGLPLCSLDTIQLACRDLHQP